MWMRHGLGVLFLVSGVSYSQDAADIFQTKCATCHSAGSAAGAPLPETLRQMPVSRILEALESGKMRTIGASLTASQRADVAKYLGVAESAPLGPESGACSSNAPLDSRGRKWNGWGIDQANGRYQDLRNAGLDRERVPRLKLKWAFGFAGVTTAFAQPTVSGGKLFVGSADGTVYSLNAQTGCVYWRFRAAEGVRTAIVLSADGRRVYFGDLHANVYAVDAASGSVIWKSHVDEHPFAVVTGTPRLIDGKLIVPVSGGDEPISAANPAYECCTFRGSLVALDAATGKQVWKTYTIPNPPAVTGTNTAGTKQWGPSGVSLWSSPTIDAKRKVIYVGTGINFSAPATSGSDAIAAFDLESGRILWSRQLTAGDVYNFGCRGDNQANCPKDHGNDADFGNSPILKTLEGGQRILVVGQKSGMVYGLDPDRDGKLLWQTRVAKGGPQGGLIWGGASDAATAYFGISDWDPGKPQAGGGLVAIRLRDGKAIWSVPAVKPACVGTPGCSAAQPAPVTLILGAVFLGSMDGHMRAYDARNGRVIWDFDTLRDFETVNGVKAHGGSINGAGAVAVNGVLYTNSGYARIPSMPGNVLLAFSVDGK
jgi:polyvinyl alcohol dehydrogenase (cytochrome)